MSENADNQPLPWTRLHSERGPDLSIFQARFDTLRNPNTSHELRALVLETPEWVNIVALTPQRHLVMVRQYRFGIGAITTEIPGGAVDVGEESGEAARRELREETGYTASRWTYLGASEPNPAFHDNLCHHWLAKDSRPTHPTRLDHGEDIAVETLTIEEIKEAIRNGEIRHSLGIVALARVFDLSGIYLTADE